MANNSIIVPTFVSCNSSSSSDNPQLTQTQELNIKNYKQNFKQTKNQLKTCLPLSVRSSPTPSAQLNECSISDSAMKFLERRCSHESTINRRYSQYNLDQIQPDLYRKRGSIISIASSYSSIHSNNSNLLLSNTINSFDKRRASRGIVVGRAQIQLNYDYQKSDFIIKLVEASLQSSIQLNECQIWISLIVDTNIYNKTQYVNCRHGKMKKIDKNGHLIDCNEEFKFAIAYRDLMDQQLMIEVVSVRQTNCSLPAFIRHARTTVALSMLNPSDDELFIWLDLESVNETINSCGELNLCLQYLPSAQRLTFTIHQATNLVGRNDKFSNVFVRALLIQDEKIILKKKKTNIRKLTPLTVWNEVLTFRIDKSFLSKCRLEVSVMDCDRFGNNSRPIGRVNFASSKHINIGTNLSVMYGLNGISAARLWRDAVQGHNTVLPQWLPLEQITTTSSLAINLNN